MENIKRMRFICYGRVQGVGFRYRACRVARELRLTGYVCNLWDGSVELELQGTADQMSRFWGLLIRNSYIDITNREVTELEPDVRENGFSVRGY